MNCSGRLRRKVLSILIPDYVYDELKEVFERNGIDFTLGERFLATYTNITIVEREFSDELVELARKVVADGKDRPVFIYALIFLIFCREVPSTYLVTGDRALKDVANKAITVDEALKLLEERVGWLDIHQRHNSNKTQTLI